MAAPKTAILVKGYPRLSETFIAQELLGLQETGLDFTIVSLRHPTDKQVHDLNRKITAPVLYLPEYVHHEPIRVARALMAGLRRSGFKRAFGALLRDFRRDITRNRLRRFAQALVLAHELPTEFRHLHAHYLHTPSSVARYTALLTGLPWSFSAHAKDIWTTPDWDLQEKLAETQWGTSCTSANVDHLKKLSPKPDRVELIYHGLDFSRFPPAPRRPARNAADPDDPFRLITVGRAVEKKGLHILLKALSSLPSGTHWHLTHIGGGEQLPRLKAMADDLGISEHVEWRGAQKQDAVIEALCEADLFILASMIAESGDRDGLPNVLMEAQALGLPCLASRVSAIPELITDGVTGRLVEPGDPAALTSAITELAGNPTLRMRLAEAGHVHVREVFPFQKGLERLASRFGLPEEPGTRVETPLVA